MNIEEENLKKKLVKWRISAPSPYMANSIVNNAVCLPQYQPWGRRFTLAMEQAFTQWEYGLSYKLAGLMVCMAIGLASNGFVSDNDAMSTTLNLAFGENMREML